MDKPGDKEKKRGEKRDIASISDEAEESLVKKSRLEPSVPATDVHAQGMPTRGLLLLITSAQVF